MNEADENQLNEPDQPHAFGEDEPMNSAESAQSITDSDLQTRQHKYHQDIQHNSYSAAVVDTESEEKKEILQSLGKLGIGYLKAKELVEKHGHKRVTEVVQHTKDQDRKNPAGHIIRALGENWTFWSKSMKDDYAYGNGEAYITGKYAAFIQY
jgi:environmental stress-induced protein Ves